VPKANPDIGLTTNESHLSIVPELSKEITGKNSPFNQNIVSPPVPDMIMYEVTPE
jgi:hypothetical protein